MRTISVVAVRRFMLAALAATAMMMATAANASANVEYVDASTQESCGEIQVVGGVASGLCEFELQGTIAFWYEHLNEMHHVTTCSLALEGAIGSSGTVAIGHDTRFDGQAAYCQPWEGTEPVNLAWFGSVSFIEGEPLPPPFQEYNSPDEYVIDTEIDYTLGGSQLTDHDNIQLTLEADGSGTWSGGTDGLDRTGTMSSAEHYVDIDVSGTQTVEAVPAP